MMPTSTNSQPVAAIMAAIRRTVAGLTALQSTNTGLRDAPANIGANRSARPSASAGGTIDRKKSASAIAASGTSAIPAACARAALAAPRPASEVTTPRRAAKPRPDRGTHLSDADHGNRGLAHARTRSSPAQSNAMPWPGRSGATAQPSAMRNGSAM